MPRPPRVWLRCGGRTPGRGALGAIAVLAGGAALLTGPTPTSAAADDAPADVTIDVALGGRWAAGDPVVVQVEVTATDLIEGAVRVSGEGGAVTVEQPLQVPAGTTKEVLLVVPAPPGGQLQVEVLDGDAVVAERSRRLESQTTVEHIGLLPQLAARLGEVPDGENLASGTGRAEFYGVSGDLLDLGAVALRSLDTIVGAADDVTALGDEQRRSLLVWVGAGGRLVLDDAQSLDALPAAWRPVQGVPYALAGLGEVRLVDGAATAGRWASFLEPSGGRSELTIQGQGVWFDAESSLSQRAGLELPDLMPLIVGLLVYGFVVGPLVYLVLRRRRRLTLAWIAIPAVAVVVAAGVVAVGGRVRDSGHPVTASFATGTPAGTTIVENVLLLGRSGGDRTLSMPAGWTASSPNGFVDAAARATLRPSGGGTEWLRRLDPGQVATTSLLGQGGPVGLEVTARATADGRIEGTITNRTGTALSEVRAFVGTTSAEVADLADGARADFTIAAPARLEPWDTGGAVADAWPFPWDAPASDATTVDWGALSAASATAEELFPSGLVRVIGWSSPAGATVDPGDGAVHVAGWSTTAPIEPSGRVPTAASIRAVVVRSPLMADARTTDVVVRYLLPAGATTDGLVLANVPARFDGQANVVRAWDGTTWVALEDAGGGDPLVPPEVVRDGVVLIKLDGDLIDASQIPTLTGEEAG